VLRPTPPEAVVGSQWTHDSSALIVTKDTGSRLELWLVSVAGGPPRKLDIDPSIWLGGASSNDVEFRVSPDGRSIAFVMGKTAAEVWALENFLPAPGARR
jgi:Tol biopolymer transport system component